MAVSTTTTPAAPSESYVEFLDTDLDKVRETKNASRKPLALLFQLVDAQPASQQSAGERGSQEGSYKRRKLDQSAPDSTPMMAGSECQTGSWSMYEEDPVQGSQVAAARVQDFIEAEFVKSTGEEDEKENVAIAHRPHSGWLTNSSSVIRRSASANLVKVFGTARAVAP